MWAVSIAVVRAELPDVGVGRTNRHRDPFALAGANALSVEFGFVACAADHVDSRGPEVLRTDDGAAATLGTVATIEDQFLATLQCVVAPPVTGAGGRGLRRGDAIDNHSHLV